MKGIEFKDQNCIFGKPSTMTDEQCNPLPTKKTTNGDFPCVESVWELTEEEIAIVLKSRRIRLGIIGNGIPPVYLQVEPLDETAQEAEMAFLKSEVQRLTHWNEALNSRIAQVVDHEAICRRQNLELWKENEDLKSNQTIPKISNN